MPRQGHLFIKLKIIHKNIYSYQTPLIESVKEMHLYPIENSQQNPLQFDLKLSPRATIQHYRDFFEIQDPHQKLEIQTTQEVQTFPDRNKLPREYSTFRTQSSSSSKFRRSL